MTYSRYVPYRHVAAYQALGWIARPYLIGTHHGCYSCWMDWPVELGEPIEPDREG